MFTRLKVSGFKNLVDVDVSTSPFTCVVGPNGVGKSNLFDAISFLSALMPIIRLWRPPLPCATRTGTSDVRRLVHRVGGCYAEKMSFEADLVVPGKAVDDLGQEAEASITFGILWSLI